MTELSVTGNTITVFYDTRPQVAAPVWTSILLTRVNSGRTRTISVNEYLSGNVTSVSLRNNPDWVTISGTGVNSTITVAPPDSITETETFSMSARATGEGGSSEEDFDVLVEVPAVAEAPVWSIIGTVILRPGGLRVLRIRDSLTNADSVDISGNPSWGQLLSGAGINCEVRILAPADISELTTFDCTLIATKGSGSETETRTNPLTVIVIPGTDTDTPDILSVVFPEGIQTQPFDAEVTFDRAVTGVTADAFELEAPTGTTIESVTRVGDTNTYRLRIVPPDDTPISLVTIYIRGGIIDAA